MVAKSRPLGLDMPGEIHPQYAPAEVPKTSMQKVSDEIWELETEGVMNCR